MTVSSIVRSHVPGRLRLRADELRRPSLNQALRETLLGWDGVSAVEGNPAAGSLLLHYDAACVERADVEARAIALLRPAEPAAPAGDEDEDFLAPDSGFSLWKMNRLAKLGMLGGLGGSLAALAVGKKLHAALGAAHVAFLLVHLATHRKRLMD